MAKKRIRGKQTLSHITLMLIMGVLISACGSNDLARADHHHSEVDAVPPMEIIPGQLTVERVMGNLTLPTKTGAVYLTILNGTESDETLLTAEIDGCEATEIHEVVLNNDVMTMRPIANGQLTIPAGEMVQLKQGDVHIMCIGKQQNFVAGDTGILHLTFANAKQRELTIDVRGIDELEQPAMSHGQHSHK